MKSRPLLIVLFVLVVGVGFFVWRSSRDAQTDTFTLADGSVLEFRGITVGSNHSYCFGNAFQRMAARIPGKLGDKLHANTVVKLTQSQKPPMVSWFVIRRSPGLAEFRLVQPRPDGRANALFRFELRDDRGSELSRLSSYIHHQLPSGDLAMMVLITNLPPTLPTIRLKLNIWRGPEDQHESAEFTAPNPLYRKQP